MPSSNPQTIGVVLDIVWQLRPHSILDIGTGYGKYGVLFREYAELALGGRCHGPAEERRVRVDGVEAFADYVGELHRVVYDNVFTGDVVELAPDLTSYDVIFLGDVLEHIDKEIASSRLLPTLLKRAKMGVLVSVPAVTKEQEAVFGNEYEIHRSGWRLEDFRKVCPVVDGGVCGNHLVVFLRADPGLSVQGRPPLKRRFRRAMEGFKRAW